MYIGNGSTVSFAIDTSSGTVTDNNVTKCRAVN
jgi:hypothetical protein